MGSDHRQAYRRAMTPSTMAGHVRQLPGRASASTAGGAGTRGSGGPPCHIKLSVATGRDESQLDDAAEVWRRWAVEAHRYPDQRRSLRP